MLLTLIPSPPSPGLSLPQPRALRSIGRHSPNPKLWLLIPPLLCFPMPLIYLTQPLLLISLSGGGSTGVTKHRHNSHTRLKATSLVVANGSYGARPA
jgi:hypothetical protein